jgi:hypothetical protein
VGASRRAASGWEETAAAEFEQLEATFDEAVYHTKPRFIGYLDDRPVAPRWYLMRELLDLRGVDASLARRRGLARK